jgi:hypothetical protein
VPQAEAVASWKFTGIEVGVYVKEREGGIYNFYAKYTVLENNFHLPNEKPLPRTDVSFRFVC